MNYKSRILAMAMLAVCTTALAQTEGTGNPHATVKQVRELPLVTTKINLLTRTYGDSIVLRWAAEDYVSWKYLCEYGVNVLRVPKGDSIRRLQIDTLAYGLKPLTLEQFQAKYPPEDSLALVPQGVLYGDAENRKTDNSVMGRTLEYNNEQDISFGFAMLVAEWRKDLATDMAVRLVDRTAEPGKTYDYYVQPTQWENDGVLIFEPGVAENVVNVPYKPEAYNPRMTDSLSTPHTLTIGWWDGQHSSFEIERRYRSSLMGEESYSAWERATQRPYVSMVEQPEGEDYCLFGDSVPELGIWEYRIRAYDAFGDLTEASPAHSILVRDMDPPRPPMLKYIVLERPETNPSAKVIAHIVWEKSTLESDLAGYRIYYSSNRQQSESWRPLNQDLLSPHDTLYTADVTRMGTSMVYVAAYDDWGNESRSFVQMMRVDDYEAPAPPDNFKAKVEKDGRVILTWDEPAEDVEYYQVAFANDTTHQWNILSKSGLTQPMFTDTLAMDLNQKYIYYKVRAVDFSTNEGEWSKTLQVKRPTLLVPAVAHLDSAWVDTEAIHMEWVTGADEQMSRHYLYRWQEGDKQRTVIARCNADSVKAQGNIIRIDDTPPYDRNKRYYYAMESFNTSHISSGLSLVYSARFRPPLMIECKLDLAGDFLEKEQKAQLAWTISDMKDQDSADYYLCIYRQGQDESFFRNIKTVAKDSVEFEDTTLKPGQQAQYYIRLMTKDGRTSKASNIVTVTAPRKD